MAKIFLILLVLVSSAWSKTIIISDIDDTLKASHINDKLDAISRMFRTEIAFEGSSELFRFLDTHIPDTSFFYVTNAPKWLMTNTHLKFLEKNKFPKGMVYLQSEYSRDEHKVKIITQIINQENAQRVILFGDNGERDIAFYDQIVRELKDKMPNVEFVQFIRHVYEGPSILQVRKDQYAFVTTLGVLSAMSELKWDDMDQVKLESLAMKHARKILMSKRSRISLLFPKWLECKSFDNPRELNHLEVVYSAYNHVQKVCQN